MGPNQQYFKWCTYFNGKRQDKKVKINSNNNKKLSKLKLSINTEVDDKTKVSGDIISLVKVIDNILINAVESYRKMMRMHIKLIFYVCPEGRFHYNKNKELW